MPEERGTEKKISLRYFSPTTKKTRAIDAHPLSPRGADEGALFPLASHVSHSNAQHGFREWRFRRVSGQVWRGRGGRFALTSSPLRFFFFLALDLLRPSPRKTTQGSHVSDNDPARIAKAAAAAAEGHVPSRVPTAPHWSEELASDSEAAVKADINARQVTAGEAVEMRARGEAVPPGGVIPEPGQPVGEDIAALREHTVRVLAEEVRVFCLLVSPFF